MSRKPDQVARAARIGFGLMLIACNPRGVATRPLSNPALAPAPAASSRSPAGVCGEARHERARVPGLLQQGRLDRALRVIARANVLCPAQRRETWMLEVSTLAEIGRYDEARRLARKINAAGEVTPVQHAISMDGEIAFFGLPDNLEHADNDAARAEMQRRFAEAVAIEQKADALERTGPPQRARALRTKAAEQFLEAWAAWQPQGEALYRAGHNARLAGDQALAQRSFDRALTDLERVQRHLVTTVATQSPQYRDAVAWSPDGSQLAVGADRNVELLDADTLDERAWLDGSHGEGNRVVELVFSPTSRLLASRDLSGPTRLWRVADGALVQRLDRTDALAFAPDGMITTAESGQWAQRRLVEGVLVRALDTPSACQNGNLMTFSQDGTLLATHLEAGVALDGTPNVHYDTVGLWRASEAAFLRRLSAGSEVHAAAFSTDGTVLATATESGDVGLWRIRDGALIRNLSHDFRVTRVVFSPDAALLATVSGNLVRLWRVRDGLLLRELKQEKFDAPLAFSPDASRLDGRVLRVWRVHDGALLRTLDRRAPRLRWLGFSPDGKALGIATEDGAIHEWGLDHGGAWRTPVQTDQRHAEWQKREKASQRSNGPELSVRMCGGKHGPIAANGRLVAAAGADEVTVRICRATDGELLLSLGAVVGADAAYVRTPSGYWDFLGTEAAQAEALVRCRVGARSFPFELCRERLHVPGLVAKVLGGREDYENP